MRELSSFQSKKWMKKIAQYPRKFRDRRGVKNGNRKLSEAAVYLIRTQQWKIKDFVKVYGVSARHVYSVRARKCWRHI